MRLESSYGRIDANHLGSVNKFLACSASYIVGRGEHVATHVGRKLKLLYAIVRTMWETQKTILSNSDEVIQSLLWLEKSPKEISKDGTMGAMKNRGRHFGYCFFDQSAPALLPTNHISPSPY